MNFQVIYCLFFVLSLFTISHADDMNCSGTFPNPITDICWEGMFPIKVGGFEVGADQGDGTKTPIFCTCPKPPMNQPTPGIRISFFEPTRLMDVTRTPYCMVNLGGMKLGGDSDGEGEADDGAEGGTSIQNKLKDRGTVKVKTDDMTKSSFWQVHYYMYPVLYLFELLTEFVCMDKGVFDVNYMTEFDPLWNRDTWALIQNPEAMVFGNIIAQAACALDCQSAMLGFPRDEMFWCAGCHGSIYPFTGTVPAHVTSAQATELAAIKFIAMQHRRGMMHSYVGDNACGASPCPIIQKSMYKLQMVNPVASTSNAVPIGRSDLTAPRHAQREIIQGSCNYGYLIFRKRNCCLL